MAYCWLKITQLSITFSFLLYSDHPFQVRCQQKIIMVENGPLKLLVGDQGDFLLVKRRGIQVNDILNFLILKASSASNILGHRCPDYNHLSISSDPTAA